MLPSKARAMSQTDTGIIERVRDASLPQFEEDFSGCLKNHDSKGTLKVALDAAFDRYMNIVSEGLIKERLGLAVCTTFWSLGKAPLRIPNEVLTTIIVFVGDGFDVNPMTATIAGDLATIRNAWDAFEVTVPCYAV